MNSSLQQWLAVASLPLLTIPGCSLDTLGLGAPSISSGSVSATSTTSIADPVTTSAGTTTGSTSTGSTSTGETTTTAATSSTSSSTSTGCVPLEWFFDIDKDGYAGPMSTEKCEAPGPGYYLDPLDCDDSNPKINPDALEVCDAVDNDCDGGIDEYPAAVEGCNGCTSLLGVSSTYYRCDVPERTWDEARAKCMTLLGDLVSINDADEGNLITAVAGDLRWWIGLTDSASEGEFVWVDNSPLDPNLAAWANGEPSNTGDNLPGPANCVTLETFGWRDQSCLDTAPIICEAPF